MPVHHRLRLLTFPMPDTRARHFRTGRNDAAGLTACLLPGADACALERVQDRPHLHMGPCPAPRRADVVGGKPPRVGLLAAFDFGKFSDELCIAVNCSLSLKRSCGLARRAIMPLPGRTFLRHDSGCEFSSLF